LPAQLHGADIAVNLHGAGPQSHRVLLSAAPRRLIAFAHPEVPEHAGPPHHTDEHEVRRWCRLLSAAGIPADPADLDLPCAVLARAGSGARRHDRASGRCQSRRAAGPPSAGPRLRGWLGSAS
jgi:hypothetical protein